MKKFLERLLATVAVILIDYAMLRWAFGVNNHLAVGLAYMVSPVALAVYRIERRVC